MYLDTLNPNKENVNIDCAPSSLAANLPTNHRSSCLVESHHQERPFTGLIWRLNPVLSFSKLLIIRSKHLPQVLRCAHEKQFYGGYPWKSIATRVVETSKLLSEFAAFSHEVCGLQSFIDRARDGTKECHQKSNEEQPI